uniref:Protein BZZ1-like n=1 Tax=Saccoglossus kowalevskii TaxID=10224 RepID=A0ABM0MJF1_SACKO|nr:PREDICTED: protein BZZ1-like [Saccoglossus kowalevskii]
MAHSHAHFCGSFTCPVCMIGFTSALDMEQHWVQEHSFGEELNVRRVEELDSNDGISVPQDIIDSQCHTFRIKSYRHPRNCDLCKQIIWSDAVQCRVCKYACHKKCESKNNQIVGADCITGITPCTYLCGLW